jgi:RHS repeat-associated protein
VQNVNDPSGDVTYDGINQYLYDAEGRICAVATTPIPSMTVLTGYIYDAGGTRVAKGTISSWSCNPAVNGFKTVNDYVLGLGGEQVTEMGVDTTAGSGTTTLAWQHTNVFAGGKLLGTYDKDGLHFYFDDPLGTRRAQTDYAGHLEQTCQSLPFGDQLACTGGDLQAPTEHHFTGKERDTESGNDYFPARYYSSAMGRWLSPDWSAKVAPVPYAKLDNPQSLNLYSYMLNNPLSGFDPDGHAGTCGGSDGSSCKVTMTQITQNVSFYDKNGNVSSTVKVTTDLTTISNSKTGAIVSANATGSAENVSGHAFSSSQLGTIGSTIAGVQQAGASMSLGSNPAQLMTAITAKESTLGIAAPVNPLQLSCSSGTCSTGDRGSNIQGALNVLQNLGRKSNYDPASTYSRYNGVPDLDQRRTNVNNFMDIYNGMSQSSWGWSPSMPAAPVPPGLQ